MTPSPQKIESPTGRGSSGGADACGSPDTPVVAAHRRSQPRTATDRAQPGMACTTLGSTGLPEERNPSGGDHREPPRVAAVGIGRPVAREPTPRQRAADRRPAMQRPRRLLDGHPRVWPPCAAPSRGPSSRCSGAPGTPSSCPGAPAPSTGSWWFPGSTVWPASGGWRVSSLARRCVRQPCDGRTCSRLRLSTSPGR
jgi:hypothetical protein